MFDLTIFVASERGDLETIKYLIGIEGEDINIEDNFYVFSYF